MTNKLITITRFQDSTEAEMAKQLLADNGIEAVVTGQNAANIYSGLPALGGYCKVEVFENKAQEAREILENRKTQQQ
jgi:hypothetical protein